MKISVVICAYNAERTVARTIESVLAQSYTKYEIVVINDGSKDSTLEILNKYQNENPDKIVIKSIPNGGLANARNHGIALCTGDLYMNLDADDYLEADTFEKAMEVFSKDDQIDVCFYGYKDFYEEGHFFGHYSETKHYLDAPVSGLDAFQMRLRRYIWICQGSAVYRMSMIRKENIRNHPGKNQGEDMYFISRCLLAARKVTCFRGDNFCCMTRSDSMNHSGFNPSFFQVLELMDCLEEDVRSIYPDRLDEILPYIQAERITQTLAIIKRMARSMPVGEYKRKAMPVLRIIHGFDTREAENLLSGMKKMEYRICNASLTAYYFTTKIHDLLGKNTKMMGSI